MPIKGLTDKDSLAPSFPRLGKLRKGGPKPARGFGEDLDHFRFTSEQPEVVREFHKAYGEQPEILSVYLPYKTPEENFDTWCEEWSASGLVHRCDSETCIIHRDKNGQYSHVPKPCPYASGEMKRTKTNPGCQDIGRLNVILPELLRAGYVGYVTLETHSNTDLRRIMAALRETHEHRPQGLQGIPFELRRYKDKISTPDGNGGRARREKYLVMLVPMPTWIAGQLAQAHAEAFAELPETATVVNEETGEIIEGSAIVLEDEPEPQPQEPPREQPQPPAEKLSRPLDAFQVRDGLRKREKEGRGGQLPATSAQVPFLARKFTECFAGDDNATQNYHTCLAWLWPGATSAKDTTLDQASATLLWLLALERDETGDTPLHQYAPEEARRVLRQAEMDAGQGDLFEIADQDIPASLDDVDEIPL